MANSGEMTPGERPRLLPEVPLPPYSYVTGRFPHPLRDPAGHRMGHDTSSPPPPDPARWSASREYLYGLDLFNHGFYWEAHEAWEGLWHALGRQGVAASFFKGLIKLAAAGVKAREGRPDGVRRHARRAAELLDGVRSQSGGERRYFGLDLDELVAWARALADGPDVTSQQPAAPVEIVFSLVLRPE